MDTLAQDRSRGVRVVVRVRPPLGLARALMVLLAMAAVVQLLSTFADWSQASLLAALRDGTRTVTEAEAQASDDRVAAFSGITLLVFLAAAVCMITWLWQSVRFQQVVLRRQSRFSRGWAIGAWFVPFLSLVRPKQIVDDVWVNATQVAYGGQSRPRTLLHAWWAFYLGGGLFGSIAVISNRGSTGGSGTDGVDSLVQGAQLSAIGDGLTAVAAVLAVVWLGQLRRAQAAADAIAMDAARQQWAAYGVIPGAPVGPAGQWTVPPYGQAPYGQAPYGQAPYGQAPYGQAPYGQAPYGQAPYGQPGPYGPPAAPRPAQWPPPPSPNPPRAAEWPPPPVPPAAPGPADSPRPGTPPVAPRPAQWPPPPTDEHRSPPQSHDEPQAPDPSSGRSADGPHDV
jgi:hypothetical protein